MEHSRITDLPLYVGGSLYWRFVVRRESQQVGFVVHKVSLYAGSFVIRRGSLYGGEVCFIRDLRLISNTK